MVRRSEQQSTGVHEVIPMDSDVSSAGPSAPGDARQSAGLEATSPQPPTSRPSPLRPKGWALPAWLVIIAMCLLIVVIPRLLGSSTDSEREDPVGLTFMQFQGKYVVGAARLLPVKTDKFYEQTEAVLNIGTVGQRQRFIILAAELVGPDEARRQLEQLDVLIADPPVGEPVQLSEAQAAVQRILHQLFPAEPPDPDAADATAGTAAGVMGLAPADRDKFVEQLGWFGELGLALAESDDVAAREAALRPARIVVLLIFSVLIVGIAAGFVGFIGLILLIVFTLMGTLRSGLGSSRPHHAVYAETFAVWMVVFFGLQLLAELISTPETAMLLTIIMFFASLLTLAWPVVRGIPWPTVRQDVGLTLGRMPLLEPCVGLGGYLATLPLLAIGLVLTLTLILLQSAVVGEPPTFAPSGGPAHPIFVYMTGSDLWPKLQILFLAAVAAPIVEETMFRGVLYRHLRDATNRFGLVLSVLLSALINGFVFAAIHPQGFVAVPALMSLALGMALVREWRGTLIPSMMIHAVHNGLIVGLLMIVLGV